jgi:hypothetical protein
MCKRAQRREITRRRNEAQTAYNDATFSYECALTDARDYPSDEADRRVKSCARRLVAARRSYYGLLVARMFS